MRLAKRNDLLKIKRYYQNQEPINEPFEPLEFKIHYTSISEYQNTVKEYINNYTEIKTVHKDKIFPRLFSKT